MSMVIANENILFIYSNGQSFWIEDILTVKICSRNGILGRQSPME